MTTIEKLLAEKADKLRALGAIGRIALWCQFGEYDDLPNQYSWVCFANCGRGYREQFNEQSFARIAEAVKHAVDTCGPDAKTERQSRIEELRRELEKLENV